MVVSAPNVNGEPMMPSPSDQIMRVPNTLNAAAVRLKTHGMFWVRIVAVVLAFLLTTACDQHVMTTQDIPNPRYQNAWVLDLEEDLSNLRNVKLNDALRTLYAQTGIEMFVLTAGAIYTLPEYGIAKADQLAEQVFDEWNVGQKSGDGIVLVVSDVGFQVALKMTESLESRLPPTELEPYLFNTMIPDLSGYPGYRQLYSINLVVDTLGSVLTGEQSLADLLGLPPRPPLPIMFDMEHPPPPRVKVLVERS